MGANINYVIHLIIIYPYSDTLALLFSILIPLSLNLMIIFLFYCGTVRTLLNLLGYCLTIVYRIKIYILLNSPYCNLLFLGLE